MTSYDVIIAGTGHNGLVAANYLAKAGKKVLILEAQEQIGGATQSVKAFEDYEARLSRYSYLIALLPDKIISDLGLSIKTKHCCNFINYIYTKWNNILWRNG